YRLNVVEVHLPPLRERSEDIPLLAEFFLQRLARKYNLARLKLSSEAIDVLQKHRWTGNVRELENTMARACALAQSSVLLPADIPFARSPWSDEHRMRSHFDALLELAPKKNTNVVDWLGREMAKHALELSDNDPAKAASLLKIQEAELEKFLVGE
ncbi:MAG: sigma-54-dependent Fis family transcriptional regulator, partial [Verrucomicrobiota bacterium JB023]|nr:sigma-54-dependent Fis family transcriptional regulator [Verrucomicrobiota bacterium JB023]